MRLPQSAPNWPRKRCSYGRTAGSRTSPAARGGAADSDPDHAGQGRSRRPLRPPPLGGAPPRRGGPASLSGREDRDRPPIENGFYYDFEFPEPISEADLPRIEEEIMRELKEGRAWEREDLARRGAAAVPGGGRGVQGRARRHGRRRHLALHPGRLHRSLPRAAPAGLPADQGDQAHGPRRCLLAR